MNDNDKVIRNQGLEPMTREDAEFGRTVAQSNPLIAARYKMTEFENKLLRVVISKITPARDEWERNKKLYRLDIKEMVKFLGSGYKDSGKLYERSYDPGAPVAPGETEETEEKKMITYVHTAANRLQRMQFKIKKPNNEEPITTSWFASVQEVAPGVLEFEFSIKLKEELLRLKEDFTAYMLKNIARLRGAYTVRMYELIRRWATRDRRHFILYLTPKDIPADRDYMADFNLLNILGYPRTYRSNDVKQFIIDKAYREITTKTDLRYAYKPVKQGRKIIGFYFYDIRLISSVPPSLLQLVPGEYRGKQELQHLLAEWIEKEGEQYVERNIHYTLAARPKKWLGYFRDALLNDYGSKTPPPPRQELLPEAKRVLDIPAGTIIKYEDKTYVLDARGGTTMVINGTPALAMQNTIKKMLAEGSITIEKEENL